MLHIVGTTNLVRISMNWSGWEDQATSSVEIDVLVRKLQHAQPL